MLAERQLERKERCLLTGKAPLEWVAPSRGTDIGLPLEMLTYWGPRKTTLGWDSHFKGALLAPHRFPCPISNGWL